MYVIVCSVAMLASGLTLISGFGLGTLLLPAFSLFFPVEVAVAATAVVHLLNNLFKLVLVGRFADVRVVLRFGIPALLSALVGAWLLLRLAHLPELFRYRLGTQIFSVSAVPLTIGVLIAVFAWIEGSQQTEAQAERPLQLRGLPLGGLLAGFFGGLSGHQGALRSAVLIHSGLSREAYIGTGVVCATLVDLARLATYAGGLDRSLFATADTRGLIVTATLAAFVGAFVGVRVMRKVTLVGVRRLVTRLLVLLGVALAAGWV